MDAIETISKKTRISKDGKRATATMPDGSTKNYNLRAVEHKPKYFDDSALVLTPDVKQGELYGVRAVGWCCWPNVWNHDFLICRASERMRIEATRDVGEQPIAGKELLRWKQYQRRLVDVEFNGERMVKRLLINMASRAPQLHFHADNAREYNGPSVAGGYKDEVILWGVVELIVPTDRTLEALPESLHSEYARLAAESGVSA